MEKEWVRERSKLQWAGENIGVFNESGSLRCPSNLMVELFGRPLVYTLSFYSNSPSTWKQNHILPHAILIVREHSKFT